MKGCSQETLSHSGFTLGWQVCVEKFMMSVGCKGGLWTLYELGISKVTVTLGQVACWEGHSEAAHCNRETRKVLPWHPIIRPSTKEVCLPHHIGTRGGRGTPWPHHIALSPQASPSALSDPHADNSIQTRSSHTHALTLLSHVLYSSNWQGL